MNREGFGMKNKTFYQFKRAVPFCMSSPYRFVWLCVVFIMISCNYQQQCCSGLLVFWCFLHTSGKPHTLFFPTFDLVFGFVFGTSSERPLFPIRCFFFLGQTCDMEFQVLGETRMLPNPFIYQFKNETRLIRYRS